MRMVISILKNLSRTKNYHNVDVLETKMKRCLSTLELTLIGIGGMIGGGSYVLMGIIAKEITGPAVSLSFLMAALVSSLSAWCYAELAVRIPRAGSAYVYSYVSVGELAAFIVGWNLILENVFSAAAVARSLVGYLSSLVNSYFRKTLLETVLESDIMPPTIIIAFCVLVSFGVKGYSTTNGFLVYLNVSVLLLFIVIAFCKADIGLWEENGGYFPFGISSVSKGASQAYFAFVGYDTLTIASEEVSTPEKSIPIALFSSVSIVSGLYCFTALGLSLTVPYQLIDTQASLSFAMNYVGVIWAQHIIEIGAIFAILCVLMSSLFAMSRCIYALANDGLIFKILSNINSSTQSPVLATLVGGCFVSILAFFLSLSDLVEMLSVGTLTAYVFIALNIIIIRYLPIDPVTGKSIVQDEESNLLEKSNSLENVQKLLLSLYIIFCILASAYFTFGFDINNYFSLAAAMILILILILILFYFHYISQQNPPDVVCKVPLLPYFPGLSIFLNIFLITTLNHKCFLGFFIWMCIGLTIYSTYGYRNSSLNDTKLSSKL